MKRLMVLLFALLLGTAAGQSRDDLATLQSEFNDAYRAGQYAQAVGVGEKLVSMAEALDGADAKSVASALNCLGSAWQLTGDQAAAETAFERALSIYDKMNETSVLTVENLNQLYLHRAKYRQAEALLQTVLVHTRKREGDVSTNLCVFTSDLGLVYKLLGNYDRACWSYREALRMGDPLMPPEDPRRVLTLYRLAMACKESGDYGEAEKGFQGLVGMQRIPSAPVLDGLAQVYEAMGDYDRAEALYQQALDLDQSVDTVNNLANVYALRHQYDKARPLYERAVAAIRADPAHFDPGAVSAVLTNLADDRRAADDSAGAEALYQQALEDERQALPPGHPQIAHTLEALGLLYQETGDTDRAGPLLHESLDLRQKAYGPSHPSVVSSLTDIAELSLDLRQTQQALVLAQQIAQVQDANLARILAFTSETQRLAYVNTIDPYGLFGTLGVARPMAQAILRHKGLVLDSLLEDARLAATSKSPALARQLQELQSQKDELLHRDMDKAADADETQSLRADVDYLEADVATNISGLGTGRRALRTTVEQVQAALPAGAVLVDYIQYPHYLGRSHRENRYGAIVLGGHLAPVWVPIATTAALEDLQSVYRSQGDDVQVQRILRALYDTVWAPVQSHFPPGTRTVVVSPDGCLNLVSLATLLAPDNRFVAERYRLRYVASGRDLLTQMSPIHGHTLVAVGDPQFDAVPVNRSTTASVDMRGLYVMDVHKVHVPRLPGTLQECHKIVSLARGQHWSVDMLTGPRATEAAVRHLRAPTILHLATHGFFLPEGRGVKLVNPMLRSGLALAGAERTLSQWGVGRVPPTANDGILMALEVGTMDLHGTWLVTLSACDTGTGTIQAGEGILGLRRAFVQAGTQQLLITLWPVADRETAALMADFYGEAFKGGQCADSLSEVQRRWLVRLRRTEGLSKAVSVAGPFIMTSQGPLNAPHP